MKILILVLTLISLQAQASFISHDTLEKQIERVAWMACFRPSDIKDDSLRAMCLQRSTAQIATTNRNLANEILQPAMEGLYRGLYFSKYSHWPKDPQVSVFCRVEIGFRGPRCSVRAKDVPDFVAVLTRLDPLEYDIEAPGPHDHD